MSKELEETQQLPDGSGFFVMSLPLPQEHWLSKDGANIPPMPFRVGTKDGLFIESQSGRVWPRLNREKAKEMIRAAARYAIRASTMNGTEIDFDPDAMVQNFVVGLLGYNTPTGLSPDEWENPAPQEET